jgi:hypothetical protein
MQASKGTIITFLYEVPRHKEVLCIGGMAPFIFTLASIVGK